MTLTPSMPLASTLGMTTTAQPPNHRLVCQHTSALNASQTHILIDIVRILKTELQRRHKLLSSYPNRAKHGVHLYGAGVPLVCLVLEL